MADYSITGDTRLDTSGFDRGVNQMSSGASSLLSGISKAVTAATAAAVAGCVAIVKQAYSEYATYEQQVGGIQTLYKDSADEMLQYAKDAYKTAGLSANAYMEQATSFAASLVSSLQGDTAAAAEAANTAIIDMSDNANRMGTDTQRITDAYQGFAKQNFTMLDNLKLGFGGTKTEMERLLATAQQIKAQQGENVKYSIDSFADIVDAIHTVQVEMGISGLTAEQAAQQVASGAMTQEEAMAALGTTAKEAADTLEGSAGQASAAWTNLLTGLGDENADLTLLTTQLIESAQVAGEQMLSRVQVIAQQLGTVIADTAPLISEALPQVVEEVLPHLLSAGGQLLAGVGAGIIAALPSLATCAMQAATTLAEDLSSHTDELVATGLQLLEGMIIGMTDALPALLEAAGALIANLAAELLRHTPDILACGGAILTTLVDGILYGIANLGEAALACVAKLLGVWDGSMDEWGHIGENIVQGLANGIKNTWGALVSGVKDLVSGMVGTVKNLLGIHSPSKVFDEIGLNLCRGLAQGIQSGTPAADKAAKQLVASVRDTAQTLVDGISTTVETYTQILTDGTAAQRRVITQTQDAVINGALKTVETVRTIAADGTEAVTQSIQESAATSLDGLWKVLKAEMDTGVLGTVDRLMQAVQQGDWLGIGQWVAGTLYAGLTADQQSQIENFAMGLVQQLNAALGEMQTDLAQAAWDLGRQLYDGITSGFGDVLLRTKELGAALQSTWEALKGPLSTAAQAISAALNGGLISAFPAIYTAVGTLIGSIGAAVQGLLTAISTALSATIFGIPAGLVIAGAAVALGAAIAAIVANIGKGKPSSNPGGGGGGGSGAASSGGKTSVVATDTDISTITGADGTKTTTKTITETLRDEAGNLTTKVTKIITETGTKLVDGVERSFTKVTTSVDGIVQKVDTTLEDIAKKPLPKPDKPETPEKPDTDTPPPSPGEDALGDALQDNTAALEQANAKLTEMMRQADSLVLSDNMAVSSTVAASGSAQIAQAAAGYHKQTTNITQNIYSKAQTAADLMREARWEADRAKAQGR